MHLYITMPLGVCQGVFEDFFDTLDLIAKFFSLGLPSGTDFCKFRPSISGGKDLIRPPYKTFFLYDCERLERLRRSFGLFFDGWNGSSLSFRMQTNKSTTLLYN